MKRSELYHIAMNAVLDSEYTNDIKLAVIAVLMADKNVAEFVEKQEEQKNG